MKIVFALGNPGEQFVRTRHNTGFMIIDRLAEIYAIRWKKSLKFDAEIAEILNPNEKILLVKPLTYYNKTGESVLKILEYYKINHSEDLMVVHDELMLPFGTIRLRSSGRDAGNNGIKSINSSIGTKYDRLKIGIKNDISEKVDADQFVLGYFSKKELDLLKDIIIPTAVSLIEGFIAGNKTTTSMNFVQ